MSRRLSTRALVVVGAAAAVLVLLVALAAIWQTDRNAERASRDRDLADLRELLEQSLANDATQTAQITALQEQVRSLGGTPVTTPAESEGSGTSSAPSIVVAPPASTPTPVTNPGGHAPPGQQKKCTLSVLGLCI